MSKIFSQQEVIDWYRNYANLYERSDEEIYNLASEYSINNFGKPFKPYVAPTPPPSSNGQIRTLPMDSDESRLSKIDTSPKKVEGLLGLAASIGTDISLAGGLAEYFPEGIDLPGDMFDISPEFFQKSYNESLAGQAYQAIYGQPAYDIGDYKADWLGEAGSFLLGMFNAPEAVAYLSGAKLGLWAGRGATTALHKAAMKGMKTTATQKGTVSNRAIKTAMVESGLTTGISLGTLGAAHSATHSAAKQKTETGEIDATKVFLDGAKGFGESFLIGAPAGAVAKGYLGSKYAMAKMASDKETLSLTKQALYGVPSQIGTEALAFTTLPTLYKGLGSLAGVEVMPDTPSIFDEGFTQALFQNTVVIGTMAGTGYAYRKFKGVDETHDWARKLLEQGKRDIEKVQRSTENVKSNLEEAGVKIDPEMLKLISETNQEVFVSESDYNNFVKKQKAVTKSIDKLNKGEKLSDKEMSEFARDVMPVKLAEIGLWKELENNPETFRKIIEKTENRTVNDIEMTTYETALKKTIKENVDAFDVINGQMTGISSAKKAKTVPGTDFTPVVLERQRKILLPGEEKLGMQREAAYTQEQYNTLLKDGFNEVGVKPAAEKVSIPEQPTLEKIMQEAVDVGLGKRGVGLDKQKSSNRAQELIEKAYDEVFTYTEKKAAKTSSNKRFVDDRINKMKDVVADKVTGRKDDINSVLSYGLEFEGGKKIYRDYSSKVADYVNWLHKNKKKTVENSDARDVHEYVEKVVMQRVGKNKVAPSDVAPFSKFYEYIDNKFHPNGLRVQKAISYKEINENRFTTIGGPKEGVDVKLLKNIDKNVDRVVKELSESLSGTKLDQSIILSKLIKYGFRGEELAKMESKNLKFSKEEGWYIDLGFDKDVPKISKADTRPTVIPIPEKLGLQIQEFAKNSQPNKPIFKNFNINNVAHKKKIAQLVLGKEYDRWDLNRTLLNTKASELNIPKEAMDVYLRHGATALEKIYVKPKLVDLLKRHKEIQKQLGIHKEGKLQAEVVGPPESVKTLAPWLDSQIKKNPGLTLKKLKDADFVGRFYEGVIDVTMGKANKFTFFHENAHRLKAMIDASGNKRLNKAWNQAEKLFKKEAKGRNMEEFLADEIANYGLKRQQPANLKSKMKGWLNRLWSNVKSVFFGKESLTKNDVKNILGEKVYQGFAFNTNARATSLSKYKYGSVEELSKGVKKEFDSALEKNNVSLSAKEKKALVKYIAETAGVENPESFKLGSSELTEADIERFRTNMAEMPFTEMKGTAELVEKARIIRNIDLNGKKVFTPEQKKNVMKLLGFKKETLWGSDIKELKAFASIINSTRMPSQERISGIAESATQGELSKIMSEMDGVIGNASKYALPVDQVIRKLGAKDIAGRLTDHVDIELNHVGKFILFEVAGERLLGRRNFTKAKDNLYLIDIERYIERKNLGILKKSEQNFIDKAFKSDWVITGKDGKLIKNPKYKKLTKAVNKNTNEGKMILEWDNYTDYVYKSFQQAVKANLSEAEYANFQADNKINWIRDNIYVSRIITPDFKRVFASSNNLDKLVEEQAVPQAKKLAKEKYKTDRPSDEQIGSMMEQAETYVRSDMYDMMNFAKGKHSTRFLKSRHTKLPEFVEIDGKKIKVYETKYEDTVKKYALGMSKFIANTEVFPDFVEIKGYNFRGQKAALNKLEAANPKWGRFIIDNVEKQLGYGKNFTNYGDMFSQGLAGFAQFMAKTQLSFPTSGLKNAVLGQAATLQAFRVRDYFRALAKTMSKEFRDEVKGMGATEIGLRHITDLKVGKYLDKIFWFGGMKPSENFNRYMSVAASKIQQQRLVKTIGSKYSTKKQIEKAEKRLKDFYDLNEQQIGLLKKYGMNNVDGVQFKSKFEKAKQRRVVQNVYNKMSSMAHIKTQGASLSIFMPEWAEGSFMKPLTLFKRMAYASTTNSLNNFNIARKNGDLIRMTMLALGPYLTGTALMAVYDSVFGQKPPKENSDSWTHMKQVFIRGEALGVLSDFLRLYEGEDASTTLYPAVWNYTNLIGDTLIPLSKGQKNWGQARHEVFQSTFGAYRGVNKLIDKRNNQEFVKKKAYRKLYYDFLEETFPNKDADSIGERQQNRRSPYYADFNKYFYKGSIEEFTKHAIIMTYAVATDLYNENLTASGLPTKYKNFNQAYKQAITQLKNKLKTVNPNPTRFMKDNTTKLLWIKWLGKDKDRAAEYAKELSELDKFYSYRVRKFKELLPIMMQDKDLHKMVIQELKKLK
tara:strand:+ start:1830 stop:8552 length:6723 start_codon:yes stop_codon:yes gene_type:complete